MIPRRVYLPGYGWGSIRPLQYGDLIRFYENAERSPAQLAAVFRRAIVGFDDCREADIQRMPPTTPTLFELAVLSASDALDDQPAVDDDGETDDGPHAKPDPGTVDSPDDSMWAADNKPAHQQAADAADLTDADLQYILHEHNETAESISRMLLSEIRLLLEGAERAAQRQDQQSGSDTTSSAAGIGNKSDRAAQLGYR